MQNDHEVDFGEIMPGARRCHFEPRGGLSSAAQCGRANATDASISDTRISDSSAKCGGATPEKLSKGNRRI